MIPSLGRKKLRISNGQLLKVADVLILVRIDRSFRYASGIFVSRELMPDLQFASLAFSK